MCDELFNFRGGMIREPEIYDVLRYTPFLPSVNLKVDDPYDVFGLDQKTAYIPYDVIAKLKLSDDDLIDIETKSGRRTVTNVLELRPWDRPDIIRLHRRLIGLRREESVIVRKAIRPVPARRVSVCLEEPVGEHYLKRKLQGTPLHDDDTRIMIYQPHSDCGKISLNIQSIDYEKKYWYDWGGVYMITPETQIEEIIPKEK